MQFGERLAGRRGLSPATFRERGGIIVLYPESPDVQKYMGALQFSPYQKPRIWVERHDEGTYCERHDGKFPTAKLAQLSTTVVQAGAAHK